ncbi:ZrgA family zinc uptake protein [Oceanospirillum linum]|uniref:ZrgA family zinc uptake protein n=1 Tax=Oceanospirillum linum TaxID=966 RepID=UPI00089E74D6|nr:DUF2796 domain-containing protein [Oceanospirillum linum]SEF44145.1 Protein of unknown function [Oleiphilus messinensis]SMP01525.1 Protein of unknown function [Oceanospirillum linum]
MKSAAVFKRSVPFNCFCNQHLNRIRQALSVTTALPILTLLLASPVKAADLSAHEHGVANLALAQEGHEISISFTAAADSVIGYEHEPTNKKEQEALYHADEILHHPEKWLSLPANCELEERTVSLPFLDAEGHKERHHAHDDHEDHDEHDHDEHHDEHDHDEHHDEHDHDEHHDEHDHDEHHDEHDHDEHHDEHDHDEHHDEHDHDEHHDHGHVDVEASYTFHCDSEAVSPLELKLFSQLPYLELLRIEAVSERTVVVTEWEGDGSLDW